MLNDKHMTEQPDNTNEDAEAAEFTPPPLPPPDPKVLSFAIEAARIASDSNCEELLVLDLRGRSPVTDYYVIATGTSDRQMRAVGEEIALYGKNNDAPAWHKAGMDSASWILLDFVDVVVHLFSQELRHHYDLELLWGDAPRIEWQRPE